MPVVAPDKRELMQLIVKQALEGEAFFDVFETCSSQNTKTIYLIGPYTGKLLYFRYLIRKLVTRGYRVYYLQPYKKVLSSSRPQSLEKAVSQAYQLIFDDMKKLDDKTETYLIGISLGSYLGLNVLADLPRVTRFTVVAGGVPLGGVFRTSSLFLLQRRQLKSNSQSIESVERHWVKFDEAFKSQDLKGRQILALNSRADQLIKAKYLDIFLKELTQAGARVTDIRAGFLPHIVQALSVNFRVKRIDKFLRS